jgi:hypothetical protein
MKEVVMDEFLITKIYEKIVEKYNGEKINRGDIINIISFVRIDRKFSEKFIKIMEEENLIKKVNRDNFVLMKPIKEEQN